MSTAASAAAEREEMGLHRLSCRETTFGERSFGKFPGGLEAETLALPMQGSRVRSPVREVTSHMLRGTPFYKNKKSLQIYLKREKYPWALWRKHQRRTFPVSNWRGWLGMGFCSGSCPAPGLFGCRSLSCVQLFLTPQTVARQAPLSMGILRATILEWVAISFSRGSSRLRDRTQVSRLAGSLLTI